MNGRKARKVRALARKHTTLDVDTLRMQTLQPSPQDLSAGVSIRYYHEVGSFRRNLKVVKKFNSDITGLLI